MMDLTEIILPILRKIPLFAELNEQQHHEVIKNIQLDLFPVEYDIFKEGEEGSAMYIIKAGSVLIYHIDEDEEIEEVKTLGPNDFFGEMALISNKPRNASARCLEETEVFKLTKNDFMNLLATTPGMANIISQEFINRLKENQREG